MTECIELAVSVVLVVSALLFIIWALFSKI